jgi:hypothetical protein
MKYTYCKTNVYKTNVYKTNVYKTNLAQTFKVHVCQRYINVLLGLIFIACSNKFSTKRLTIINIRLQFTFSRKSTIINNTHAEILLNKVEINNLYQ